MRSATAAPNSTPAPRTPPRTKTPSNFGAPQNGQPTNLIGWERRVKACVAENDLGYGKSKIQRIALKLHKRKARIDNDELRRILQHADPTADAAVRNVMAGGDRD